MLRSPYEELEIKYLCKSSRDPFHLNTPNTHILHGHTLVNRAVNCGVLRQYLTSDGSLLSPLSLQSMLTKLVFSAMQNEILQTYKPLLIPGRGERKNNKQNRQFHFMQITAKCRNLPLSDIA